MHPCFSRHELQVAQIKCSVSSIRKNGLTKVVFTNGWRRKRFSFDLMAWLLWNTHSYPCPALVGCKHLPPGYVLQPLN